MQHKRAEALFNSLSFVGYIVSEILMKNRKLLTLIILGMKAPLYTNKIYPALYISLYWSNMARGG